MAVTVIVKYEELTRNIFKLNRISRRTASRKSTIQLDQSKGEFAEELKITADILQETGMAFADLAARTAVLLESARDGFINADRNASIQFE